MPRPKVLEDRVTVPIVLTTRLKKQAEEIVEAKGLPSLSALIRMLLEDYIRQASISDPKNDLPDVKQLDPLTAVELEDFKESLANFEKKVQEIELAVKPLIEGRTIGPIGQRRTLTSAEMQLINRIKNLRSEWLKYKRWYKSIGHRDNELTTRLANIYNIIRALEKNFVKP